MIQKKIQIQHQYMNYQVWYAALPYFTEQHPNQLLQAKIVFDSSLQVEPLNGSALIVLDCP